MSYKYVGSRNGIDYYKHDGEYYERHTVGGYINSKGEWQVSYSYSRAEECFRDSDMVEIMRNNQKFRVRVDNVRVGDAIKTLNNGYQDVYYIYVTAGKKEVLVFEYKYIDPHSINQKTNTFGLTPQHLMYDLNGRLKQAKEFKLNDTIQTEFGDAVITSIKSEVCGVRSIISMNGELLLNNVRISSYAGSASYAYFMQTLMYPIKLYAFYSTANKKESMHLLNKICIFGADNFFSRGLTVSYLGQFKE